MPEARKPAPKGKGISRRVGGFPVWVWGVGILSAVAVGLWLRNRSHNAAQSGTAAAPAQDTSAGTATLPADTSGGVGQIPDAKLDEAVQSSVIAGVHQAIDQLNSELGANGGAFTFGTGADTGVLGGLQATGPSAAPRLTGAHNFPHPPANLTKKQVALITQFKHGSVKAKPNNSSGRTLGVAALRAGQVHVVTPTAVQHPAVTNTLRARFGAVPTTASAAPRKAA